MTDAIDRLVIKLARIYVPPYVRVRAGKTQRVDGYWKEIRDVGDLSPEESEAIMRQGKKLGADPTDSLIGAVDRVTADASTRSPLKRLISKVTGER